MARRAGRLISRREQKIAVNGGHRLWGAVFGKPEVAEQFVTEVAPARNRRPASERTGPSEHQEQVAVIQWWNAAHASYGIPHFALFAVPNGGARDPITGSRLKAEGVRSGALDLILAAPTRTSHGLFLEMKVGNNKPSDNQKAFIEYLEGTGYTATVHWSATSAIEAIKAYLA